MVSIQHNNRKGKEWKIKSKDVGLFSFFLFTETDLTFSVVTKIKVLQS